MPCALGISPASIYDCSLSKSASILSNSLWNNAVTFAIITFCSAIAGWIRVYALSIRVCSVSICCCMPASTPLSVSSNCTIRSSARATSTSCLSSSFCIVSTRAILSSLALVCSMCALLRKPKMPMLVINISTTTDMLR